MFARLKMKSSFFIPYTMKDLGIYFTSNLNFNRMISTATANAKRVAANVPNILGDEIRYLPVSIASTLYNAYVVGSFSYGAAIWGHQVLNRKHNLISNIHSFTAKKILKLPICTRNELALRELNLEDPIAIIRKIVWTY